MIYENHAKAEASPPAAKVDQLNTPPPTVDRPAADVAVELVLDEP